MRHLILILLVTILSAAFLPTTAQRDTPFIPAQREPVTNNNAAYLERLGTVGNGWWLCDVDWSPDASTIAVASLGGVLLYSAEDLYAAPIVLDGHTQEVSDVAFSPDGRELASLSLDGTIRIWDIDSRTTTTVLQFEGNWIDDVEYRSNIETFQKDHLIFDLQEVFLYDNNALFKRIPETGATQTILSFPDPPVGVDISENQRFVASTHGLDTDKEHSLRIWEFATGKQLLSIPLETTTSGLALSPDGQWLVTFPLWSGSKYLWDVDKLLEGDRKSAVVELAGPSLPVKGAVFSPDSSQLALVGWDENHSQLESSLWVWDLHNDQLSATILRSAYTGAPRLKADGTLLHYQGRVWDLRTEHSLPITDETLWNITDDFTRATSTDEIQFYREEALFSLTHCIDNRDDCRVTRRVWDIVTGNLLETYEDIDYKREVTAKNMKAVVVEGGIQLIDASTDVVLRTLPLDDPVRWSSFSQNGEKFVTISDAVNDDTVLLILWDVASGANLNMIELDQSGLRYTFSPDENLLFVWSGGVAFVWDTTTGAEQYQLAGPEPNLLWLLRFGPGGKIFAVAWGDWTNIVELRDTLSGEVIDTIEGFPNFINSAAFSPDGKLLAISSMNEVWLWNIATKQLQILSKDESLAFYDTVQFSPDSRLLSAEYTGTAYWADSFTDLWDIDDQSLIITLDGDGLQATENWDLLLTEEKGVVHLWGAPLSDR